MLPDLKSVWDSLALESRPIYLYGTGDGADKILDVLAQKHIPAAGIFVSEEFYRGQTFRGYAVTTLSQLEKQYPPDGFVVLVAFGSHLPDMIRRVKDIASRHPVLIPDVPVAGGNLFDRSFYQAHLADLQKARSLFADEQSLFVFDKILEYKLTGLPGPLFDCVTPKEEVFESLIPLNRALHPDSTDCLKRSGLPEKKESYLDLGAYSGDTIFEFLRAVNVHRPFSAHLPLSVGNLTDPVAANGSVASPVGNLTDPVAANGSDASPAGNLTDPVAAGGSVAPPASNLASSVAGSYASITAFEPDERTFRKLQKNTEGLPNLTLYHGAAASVTGTLEMIVSRGRGTRISSLAEGVAAKNSDASLPAFPSLSPFASISTPHFKPLTGAQAAGKTLQVPCFRIDDLSLSPTYVKIDVEGAEKDALLGMEATLRRCQSALNIALYHRSEDIFELPLLLHEWLPDHQFFLRRHDCFPCWEVNLYASKKQTCALP